MSNLIVNEAVILTLGFPGSANTDTVTYVIYDSDGGTFDSGSMTYLAGTQWKLTFTPTSIDTYVLEATNTTIDVVESKEYFVKAISPVASSGAVSSDPTSQEMLTEINKAIQKALIRGGAYIQIGGRAMSYHSLNDLYEIRSRLRSEVNSSNGNRTTNYISFKRAE